MVQSTPIAIDRRFYKNENKRRSFPRRSKRVNPSITLSKAKNLSLISPYPPKIPFFVVNKGIYFHILDKKALPGLYQE